MKISIARHIKKLPPSTGGQGWVFGRVFGRVLWRVCDWFFRIGKSRGFGIQSPWAYSFVTEVIGERWPYYAYKQIEQNYPHHEQKWQKLFLRVRNFTHPYPTIVIDDITILTDKQLTDTISQATPKGSIILRGINNSPEAQQRFTDIKQRPDIGITFDLYHLAIIFLDTTIYKQHYQLNY